MRRLLAPAINKWLLAGLLGCSGLLLRGQQIDRLEYFFDQDPGFGNGQAIPVTALPDIQNFAFPIDWTALNDGLHVLNVRSWDENGTWSMAAQRVLLKGALPAGDDAVYDLVAAEYFIDADPGLGYGTPVSVTNAATVSGLALPIDISALNNGFHPLSLRYKNAAGAWSLCNQYYFVKGGLPAQPFAAATVTAVEYYVDQDPGFGQATAIPFTPGMDVSGVLFGIDIAALGNGLHHLAIRSRDDQGRWSHSESSVFLKGILPVSDSQLPGLQALEYFIDTDPGQGQGTALALPAGNDVLHFVFAVDIAALSYGFHELYLRVKDTGGDWSLTLRQYLFKINPATLPGTNLVRLEYFFNTDPGIGNGTPVLLPASNQVAGLGLNLDIAALPADAFSTLYVRALDADGKWSLLHAKTFYKHQLAPDPFAGNVVKMEYFLDTDPGFGQGIDVPVVAGQNLTAIVFPVDISHLANGLHQLFVRSKSSSGKWSLSRNSTFVKNPLPPQNNNLPNLAAMEYFLDTDPGFGQGTPIAFPPGATVDNLGFPIDISTLNDGLHQLFVRSKGADGAWSLSYPYYFMKGAMPVLPAPDTLAVVRMEYFFDTDPGFGNGQPIPVSAAPDIQHFLVAIDWTALTDGLHVLNVRAYDETGAWSVGTQRVLLKGALPPGDDAVPDLVAAEYFIDADPGFGLGTPVMAPNAASVSGLLLPVDISALDSGFHRFTLRYKNAKGAWSLSKTYYFVKGGLSAQSTSAALILIVEYYIDQDPGLGQATAVSFTPGVDLSGLVFGIDIGPLDDGLHQLVIRSMDEQGRWALSGSHVFFKGSLPATSSNLPDLLGLEYFFDVDPGIGQGTALALPADVEAIDFAFAVNVAALSFGLHELFVRVQDADGDWALSQRRVFFKIDPADLPSANLLRLEYFFNTDPGFGNGTPVSLPAGIEVAGLELSLDIAALPAYTFSTLYVRALDAAGRWSLVQAKTFYKHPLIPDPNAGDLVRVEYFLDTDPGFGQGIDVPVTPGQQLENLTFPVDLGSLSNGLHRLRVRSRSGAGQWSLSGDFMFVKNPLPLQNDQLPNLVAMEYFFDADPGYGHGIPLAFPPGTAVNALHAPLDISALNDGFHQLTVRARGADGDWSLSAAYLFIKGGLSINPAPVGSTDSLRVCNGALLNYDLQSRIINGIPSDFTWMVADNPDVTGEADGSGDYLVQTLTNTSPNVQLVTYRVRPKATGADDMGHVFLVVVAIGPKPLFSLTTVTPQGTHTENNYGGPATVSAVLCTNDSLVISGFSRNLSSIGFREKITSSGNILAVPADQPENDISPSSAPGVLTGTYGPYTLMSGTSGSITRVYTPYVDTDGNNRYDAGTDCPGDPITLVFRINTIDAFAQASVKVILQGPYVGNVQLMHDSLRVRGLLPLTEPYTGLDNFTHTGGGGGEQTTPAVLAISGPNAVVDWIFLELRNAADPTQVLGTRAALLQRDGDLVDVDGASPVIFGVASNQSYFLAVRHRNHFGAQIGEANFYPACEVVETDFRSTPPEGFYLYNNLNPAQKILGGTFVLWAGNGRVDYLLKYNGSVNDRVAVLSVVGLTTPNSIVPGYLLTDYNMDGLVKYNGSVNDRNVLLGNVGIATPSAILHDQVAR